MLNQLTKFRFSKNNRRQKNIFLEKPTANIVDLYEKLVDGQIKKTGNTILVCCPFHQEKHPSCALYEKTNSFYCFSCSASGSYIDFVMKIKNVDFKGALEIIKNL